MTAVIEFLCYRYKKLPHEIGELDIDQINALLAGKEEWETIDGQRSVSLDEEDLRRLGVIVG